MSMVFFARAEEWESPASIRKERDLMPAFPGKQGLSACRKRVFDRLPMPALRIIYEGACGSFMHAGRFNEAFLTFCGAS